MFSVAVKLLSRPQRQHLRKRIPGFYAPYYGASFMKFNPVIPYRRLAPSLHHYPETSLVTGKKIDWMYGTPVSGYEGSRVYGENTIEVKGLPMGKTPEYMQERLRRYFAKFGVVTFCRALNHSLDPYQCEGTAYVSFREFSSCESAVKSTIRLGSRDMGNKVLSMRVLATDEISDGKSTIATKSECVESAIESIRWLFEFASKNSGISKNEIPDEIRQSLLDQFGSLSKFQHRACRLFLTVPEEGDRIYAKKFVNFESELAKFAQSLRNELDEALSVHWRVNAPIKDLPDYTKRQIRLWDKKDKLPFDLQIVSRDYREHRVHDEKFLIDSKTKRERSRNRAEGRKLAIATRHATREAKAAKSVTE